MQIQSKAHAILLNSNMALMTIEFYGALALRIRQLGQSRLGTTAWLDEKLFCWPGPIVNADGSPFLLYEGIIEEAYSWEESFSWNSNVKRLATLRPKRPPQKRLLLRFRLWDAAFKIDADPIVLPLE